MLDLYFSRPKRLRQMHNGPLAMHLDALARRLHSEGYRRVSARTILRQADDFSQVLSQRGLGVFDITLELVEDYLAGFADRRRRQTTANSLGHLSRHLREAGILPVTVPCNAPLSPTAEFLEEYANWMRDVQGLADGTIGIRMLDAKKFLDWWHTSQPTIELGELSGHHLLGYVRESALSQTQLSSLRQLCRYLHGVGKTAADLSATVPSRRRVRLARERKHISWEDVGRLLEAPELSDPVGLRDRAVVMLLAHLGLRSGEVIRLCLDDLDWHRGILRVVQSKGGKSRELPLPGPVGQAVADYIRYARPVCTHRKVFVRHRAPGGLLTSQGAVTGIIQRLATRAGVALPQRGANVLRHSLATHLVNRQVSIKAIADLLGHASIDTTAIYTLVDMTTLARVVRPFPEGDWR